MLSVDSEVFHIAFNNIFKNEINNIKSKMIEVKVKKFKFSDMLDITGVPFWKTDDTISISLANKATSVLEKLRHCWQVTWPDMVSSIDDPSQLKLVLSGKTISWDSNLGDYKLK